jgi:hypothetical protein
MRPLFHLTFCTHIKSNFYILNASAYTISLPPTHSLSWMTTPCQLSTTTYSIYLQLTSTYGRHLFHLQPKYVLCCGDKDPHSAHIFIYFKISESYFYWLLYFISCMT